MANAAWGSRGSVKRPGKTVLVVGAQIGTAFGG